MASVILIQIRTNYVTSATSNVGSYRATSMGLQRTNRCDQALSSDANHRGVARRLALAMLKRLVDESITLDEVAVEQVHSNDSGTERLWAVVR